MLKSMTAYGISEGETEDKRIRVEIRALNSKQLDINIKVPPLYRQKEAGIRDMISAAMIRGKIEVFINYDLKDPARANTLNRKAIEHYFFQIREIGRGLGIEPTEQLIGTILNFPDILVPAQEKPESTEWSELKNLIQKAIEKADAFRMQEGKAMTGDIRGHIRNILKHLKKIDPYEQERIPAIRKRIRENMNRLQPDESIDQGRFEQEIVFYLEKLDINEEQVRLKNHCDYFLETLASDPPAGKKLGFISQEMAREINTIGSKAYHSEIQKIVVEMKNHLEKVREQLFNVL